MALLARGSVHRSGSLVGMRKVTEKAVNAFTRGRRFTSKNTSVVVDDRGGVSLCLFGNVIATRDERPQVSITTAGWPTTTTKERLNGLPGVRVHTTRGQLYLNEEPWDGCAITLPLVA
jgi:hypothetical protein